MYTYFIILLGLVVVLVRYSKLLFKRKFEDISLKEPSNKNINLFSTLEKAETTKPPIETDCHYYMVKAITFSLDGITIINEKEYEFNNGNMYNNKVEARLFYDSKLEEIVKDKIVKLELYLIKNSNLVKVKKYLLIDSNGIELIENKKLESFLLSSMGSNKRVSTNEYEDSIYTKNSFLDA